MLENRKKSIGLHFFSLKSCSYSNEMLFKRNTSQASSLQQSVAEMSALTYARMLTYADVC
jgi:hypothetical protein